MAEQDLITPAAGISPDVLLAEVSDPSSAVVALPNRARPKLRKYANSSVARDLALIPSATRDAPAKRTVQSRPSLRRSQARPTPFVAYISTIAVAVLLGATVGIVVVYDGLPTSESFARLLWQTSANAPEM